MRKIEEIDQILMEFQHAARFQDTAPMRFLNRGVEVFELMEELGERVASGWNWVRDSPQYKPFLDSLIYRYEKAQKLLSDNAPSTMLAAATIFKGVPHVDQNREDDRRGSGEGGVVPLSETQPK